MIDLLGRIAHNARWSQLSNFTGVPTDCPNRAERLGYLGDAGVFWDLSLIHI